MSASGRCLKVFQFKFSSYFGPLCPFQINQFHRSAYHGFHSLVFIVDAVLHQVLVSINLGDGDIVELAHLPRRVEGVAVGIIVAGQAALYGVLDDGFLEGVAEQTEGCGLMI